MAPGDITRSWEDQDRVLGGENGGQWVRMGLGKDRLNLDGRIQLGSGEKLLGSDWLEGGDGSFALALTNGPDGRKLRVGSVDHEDEKSWRGRNLGSTTLLDEAGIASLRTGLQDLARVGQDVEGRAKAASDAWESLRLRQRDVFRRQFKGLSKKDARELDKLDDRLSYLEGRITSLHDDMADRERRMAEPGADTKHLTAMQRLRGGNLSDAERERARLTAARAEYVAGGTPLTAADEAEIADLDRQIAVAEQALDEFSEKTYGEGRVSGAWGDLSWRIETDETGEPTYYVKIPADDESADAKPLNAKQLADLVRLLEEPEVERSYVVRKTENDGTGGAAPAPPPNPQRQQAAAANQQSQRQYNRDGKGTSTGGQFSANPKSGQQKAKPAKAAPAKVTTPVKPIIPVPAPHRGPMKLGGDNDPEQVRQLQALLGALGLGRPPMNGQFDKATEDAVKQAQLRLGLKPTGRATSALVKKMLTAHALSPCIKRSSVDPYDILRSAAASGEFDEDEETNVTIFRSYALEDIEIQRGGDGRTVTAYAAMFNEPYEVRDQYGHYMEQIERSAFNRTLSHGTALRNAVCLYNHGFTASGAPDMLGSVPLGTPLEIRAEPKGLLTITRYNKSQLADSVLEAIRAGDIKSQSFRGRIIRSSPERVPRVRSGQPLPTITRNELGLSDYGPTPFAVNQGAEIVAVRSRSMLQLATDLQQLDAEGRQELMRMLSATPTIGQGEVNDDEHATPETGPGAGDSPNGALLSAQDITRKIRAARIARENKR